MAMTSIICLFIYLFIKDFTTLSSNKSYNIIRIVSWGQINVDCYQYWLLVTIIISFESSLELRCWNMSYKGRVNERYKGWFKDIKRN